MPSFRRALVAAAVACACFPAGASAAVVDYRNSDYNNSGPFVIYGAGEGERNRLTVGSTSRSITFTDRAATVRVDKGDERRCRARGQHRVVCRVRSTLPVDVFLRDGNDKVRFSGKHRTRVGKTARTEVRSPFDLADTYPTDSIEREPIAWRARIRGGDGNDTLFGTRGDDIVIPGAGRNQADAGAGTDSIVPSPNGRADRLRGGRGIDTVDASTAKPVNIDMAAGTVTVGDRTDRFESVEKARGGWGKDTLRGGPGADGLFGDDEADRLEGLGGNDYVGGDLRSGDAADEAGIDVLDGGPGDDVVDARDDENAEGLPDRLLCGVGTDTIIAMNDDPADPSCERAAFAIVTTALDDNRVTPTFDGLTNVQPVGRGADRAPIYSVGCPSASTEPCQGYVELYRPGFRGDGKFGESLGESPHFKIPAGGRQNVKPVPNAAGQALLAQPRPLVSVNVSMGQQAIFGPDLDRLPGPTADFGWLQQLNP